jgi:type II secretory pathway component PulK
MPPTHYSSPDASRPPRGARGRRGIALVLTLLVLAILILLVVQLRLTTRLHVIQSRNGSGDLLNLYGARAALEFARLYIQTDTEIAGSLDSLQEPWARPIALPGLADAAAQIVIEDEERRFNLYKLFLPNGKPSPLGRAQLARLVAILGIPDEDLAAKIADYVDPDTEGEWEAGARNRMLVLPEELAMIPGVPPEALYGGLNPQTRQPFRGLLEFVTVWPMPRMGAVPVEGSGTPATDAAPPLPDGVPPPNPPAPGRPPAAPPMPFRLGVNLNTAPLEILLALSPELTPEAAQAIVAHRMGTDDDGKPSVFTSVTQLYRVPGVTEKMVDSLKNEVVFRSSVFSARVTCRSGNVTRRVRYVLGRGGGNMPPPLLTWWEEGGAFGLPRPEEGLGPGPGPGF